ncbi:trace amine-associated receptor 13c-like [Esox lucius]|uniref:trace amine-associated receptor 13c-like n=1 Tax=Esox lucius TaxID=8010 RepID=UPI001477710F|nr:trace amine-associated receptor 13c-like [Esox lucius]
MEEHEDAQYCFQDRNSSCKMDSLSTPMYMSLYIFFSLISVVTVFLNLLVIISISHFKHLHTPTNLLILSLAVSDHLVGLIVIPSMTVAIMESCWVPGEYFCVLLLYTYLVCTSLSLGNLVLISFDRYVAVCDPLLYHSKITIPRIKLFIFIIWCCSIIYNVVSLNLTVNVHVPSRCFEECYFSEGFFSGIIVDLFISLVIPCSIILTLYLKIFVVARSQARKVFSKGPTTVSGVKNEQAIKSERKASKTLAIVVFNYLMCYIPIYLYQCIHVASGNSSSAFVCFLLLINSLINPIIYAFLYPWFKVTVKRILTLNLRRL